MTDGEEPDVVEVLVFGDEPFAVYFDERVEGVLDRRLTIEALDPVDLLRQWDRDGRCFRMVPLVPGPNQVAIASPVGYELVTLERNVLRVLEELLLARAETVTVRRDRGQEGSLVAVQERPRSSIQQLLDSGAGVRLGRCERWCGPRRAQQRGDREN